MFTVAGAAIGAWLELLPHLVLCRLVWTDDTGLHFQSTCAAPTYVATTGVPGKAKVNKGETVVLQDGA